MKFVHTGDCHLGGWRQPELMSLNMESFRQLVNTCIKEKIDFVLIAGDLFDSAYPPIEILKDAFQEFRKLKDANIPVFLIAGSHDYSVSGKTFLEVLEKSGFAKNAFQPEERGEHIYLHPLIYKNVAIYGYPGKKSGLEVNEIPRIKLHDAPGLFKILMLHTAIRDAIGNLPVPAVEEQKLPKVDYLAMAHLHTHYNKQGRVYCGPLFPNNSSELEELKGGSFYVVDTAGKIEKREIKLKDVEIVNVSVSNAMTATETIIGEIEKREVRDKIVLLRLSGVIEKGKIADIRFADIEASAAKKGVYAFLKNISQLHSPESPITADIKSENMEDLIIRRFQDDNKSSLNKFIAPLMSVLHSDKKEDEKVQVFESRIYDEVKKLLEHEIN